MINFLKKNLYNRRHQVHFIQKRFWKKIEILPSFSIRVDENTNLEDPGSFNIDYYRFTESVINLQRKKDESNNRPWNFQFEKRVRDLLNEKEAKRLFSWMVRLVHLEGTWLKNHTSPDSSSTIHDLSFQWMLKEMFELEESSVTFKEIQGKSGLVSPMHLFKYKEGGKELTPEYIRFGFYQDIFFDLSKEMKDSDHVKTLKTMLNLMKVAFESVDDKDPQVQNEWKGFPWFIEKGILSNHPRANNLMMPFPFDVHSCLLLESNADHHMKSYKASFKIIKNESEVNQD